jgi:hypothetical protein
VCVYVCNQERRVKEELDFLYSWGDNNWNLIHDSHRLMIQNDSDMSIH